MSREPKRCHFIISSVLLRYISYVSCLVSAEGCQEREVSEGAYDDDDAVESG